MLVEHHRRLPRSSPPPATCPGKAHPSAPVHPNTHPECGQLRLVTACQHRGGPPPGTILESQAAAVAQLAQVQAQEEAELLAGGAWPGRWAPLVCEWRVSDLSELVSD